MFLLVICILTQFIDLPKYTAGLKIKKHGTLKCLVIRCMETSLDCNQDDVVPGSTHVEGNFIHNPPSKMNPSKYQCLIEVC